MSVSASHVVLPHISKTGRPRIEGIPATYSGSRLPSSTFRGTPIDMVRKISKYTGKMVLKRKGRRRKQKRRGVIRKRIPRTLAPPSQLVRANVVMGGSFTCTSTTCQDMPVRILDFSDPFGTASQQQPLGYDQWAALYQRAKVVGTKVTYTAHNSGSEPVVIGIDLVGEGTSTDVDPWDYRCEKAGTKYRILSAEIDHATLTYGVSTKKVFKIKDIKDNDDISCAITTGTPTSPSRSAWLTPWAALHNGTTSTVVDYIIKVEYIILLDKPTVPSRSVGPV